MLMKVMIAMNPTIPATIEERRELRPIARNTERFQMMLDELREIAGIADELGIRGAHHRRAPLSH
jgi:hypothetical protein